MGRYADKTKRKKKKRFPTINYYFISDKIMCYYIIRLYACLETIILSNQNIFDLQTSRSARFWIERAYGLYKCRFSLLKTSINYTHSHTQTHDNTHAYCRSPSTIVVGAQQSRSSSNAIIIREGAGSRYAKRLMSRRLFSSHQCSVRLQ